MDMKNITISVDEKTYQALEKVAARQGLKPEDLVCNSLRQLAKGAKVENPIASPVSTEEFERLRRLQDEVVEKIKASGVRFSAADRLPRDELYNRDAFR